MSDGGEAEAAVRACRFLPEGIRGWGPRRTSLFDPDYYATANDEVLISVQIEAKRALDNLNEILLVDGLDACYIGPWDLSNNLGFGVPPKWEDPCYLEAFDRVLGVRRSTASPRGCLPTSTTLVGLWRRASGSTPSVTPTAS